MWGDEVDYDGRPEVPERGGGVGFSAPDNFNIFATGRHVSPDTFDTSITASPSSRHVGVKCDWEVRFEIGYKSVVCIVTDIHVKVSWLPRCGPRKER